MIVSHVLDRMFYFILSEVGLHRSSDTHDGHICKFQNFVFMCNCQRLSAQPITPVNKLKVSATREVKNKSEVKFLKEYRLHAA